MAEIIHKGSEKHKLHLSLLEQETETQPEVKAPRRKAKKEEPEVVEQETETQPE